MRLKNIITSFSLLLFPFCVFSQLPHAERTALANFVSTHLNTNLLSDSTAFYAFNIQITVDSKNAYKPVVNTNDPQITRFITGIYDLQQYDFKGLMGTNKYIKFIIPVGVIILGAKDSPRVIDAMIYQKLSDMFYHPIQEEEKRKLEYIGPIIITQDRRIYN